MSSHDAAPAEPVSDLPATNGYEWNNAARANNPPMTYRKELFTVSAAFAILPSPTITLSPVKYPRRANNGSKSAPAAAAVAPGLSITAPAFPRIVATILVAAANTGNSPSVTKIAPIDCVKESA